MKKINILLVEDELIIGLDIKRALEGYGYNVFGVMSTGEDAVSEALARRPDLILMDIILSGEMSGIDAAKIIRATLDVPIIYLTANADPATVERARETLPSGYLNKPVSHRDLQSNIDSALFRYSMEARLRDSELRFRELYAYMKSGVAIYKAVDGGDDFVFLDINAAAEKINQIKKEDAVGQRVTKVFPGVVEMGILAFFKEVYLSGKPGQFPITNYNDGRISIWVENYVYRLPGGEIVAVHDDLTERMQMIEEINQKNLILGEMNGKLNAANTELESLNEELQASLEEMQAGNEELITANNMLMQSEENYRLLFQHAPVGLFNYPQSLIISETNEKFCSILRASSKQLKGLDMHKLKDSVLQTALEAPFKGKEGYYEGPYQTTIASIKIHVSLKTFPLYDVEKNIIGAVGFLQEIPATK